MSTLSQAGIPGISTTILHPKHKNRWRVIFSGLGGSNGATAGLANDLSTQAVSITRPSLEFEEIQLDRYNSRAYVIGKHSFSPLTVQIEDDVTNRASAAIQAQLESQQRLIGATGPWMNTEPTALGYKFGTVLELLDGNETVTESLKYEGCIITSADYQDLDYSSGEKVMISLTIRFDHVRQILVPSVTGTAIAGLVQ